MPNMYEVVQICDERMTDILDNRHLELDEFLMDGRNEYPEAKAFISFALAQHFAFKAINNGDGNQNTKIL